MNRTYAFRRVLILMLVVLGMSSLMVNSATGQSASQVLIFSNLTCNTMASLGGCYNSSITQSELYRINADGRGMSRLLSQPIEGFIYALATSPDGTRVAFLLSSSQGSGVRVYTMNTDGTSLQEILSDSHGVHYTSILWSPDGSQLLLQDQESTLNRQYLMNANGSEPQVIRAFQRGLKIYVTDWTADGRFFAFDQMGDLLWVNPDGTARTPLPATETLYYAPYAVPSHDLQHLAHFTQTESDGMDVLVITDATGTIEQSYSGVVSTNTGNLDVFPGLRWSSDDALIAYIEIGESQFSLRVIGADGGNPVQLTGSGKQVFAFDWIYSPPDSIRSE